MTDAYRQTRRSLHALAELVVAGPRFRQTGDLRLRVLPAGFGTWDAPVVAVSGGHLVTDDGRFPVDGLTYEEAAARAGLRASGLGDVYGDGPHVTATETVRLDVEAVREVEEALVLGDRALAEFRPDAERTLWPEHFDVATTVEDVNFGVSPGDAYSEVPYAYVGPHGPLTGAFWNAPFGAARPLSELRDVAATASFFAEGARLAAAGGPPPTAGRPAGPP